MLLDQLSSDSVFLLVADSQSCVTIFVASENINFSVLDDVLEGFSICAMLSCQMDNGIIGLRFFDKLVGIFAKEGLNRFNTDFGTDNGQLQRCQIMELRFEGTTLGQISVSCLN